jgi:hypothetical protein
MPCIFCDHFYNFKPCEYKSGKLFTPQVSYSFVRFSFSKLNKACPCKDCLVKSMCKTDNLCEDYIELILKPSMSGTTWMTAIEVLKTVFKV